MDTNITGNDKADSYAKLGAQLQQNDASASLQTAKQIIKQSKNKIEWMERIRKRESHLQTHGKPRPA